MRRTAFLAAALALVPGSAQAATITLSTTGGEDRRVHVHVAGTAAEESVEIGTGGSGFGVVVFAAPATFVLGEGCTQTTAIRVDCNGYLQQVSGDLGAGVDNASVSGVLFAGSVELGLGEGDDKLRVPGAASASGRQWVFDGGTGDDELRVESFADDPVQVRGGPGADELRGTPNDVLDGGEGDDVVEVTEPHELGRTTGSAAGGPGRDSLIAGQARVPLGLRLAGGVVSLGPGDGGTPFPSTTSGFEGISTGFGVERARLEGDDGPNLLLACGGATLIGNGGDDVLDGNRRADDPDGCQETDEPNTYSGGAGADEIDAANRIAEDVDCGPGVDTQVRADATDRLEGCEATGVSFTRAPSGFVAAGTATFAWTAPSAPPGSTFECALDGAAFAACASPRTLTGLAEGAHVFRVRVITAGQPAPAVEVRWTVDTVKPLVTFTQAPPSAGAPSDVDVAWDAGEPATFACAVDGRLPAPCSSPLRLAGLGPGPHTLSVVATDRAGNVSDAAGLAWVVGETAAVPPPPAPVACPAGSEATVTLGLVTARAVSACLRPTGRPGQFEAAGPVLVNGLRITPRGGVVRIDRTAGGGELSTTGPWTLGLGSASIDIDAPLALGGLASAAQRSLPLPASEVPRLLALPLRGAIGLEFAADNGGQTKLTLKLELPNVFRGTPDGGADSSAGGVTVELSATASNDLGVFFAGRGRLDTLWLFGKLKLQDLEIAFDQAARTFRGSVAISLADSIGAPGIGGDATLAATLELGPGGLFGTPLRKLALQASDLSVRVHPIVFLQRVGAELSATTIDGRPYAVLAGSAGISFGPKLELPPLFEGEVASIDGTIRLTVPAFLPPESFSLEVEGVGKLVEFEVAQAKVRYTTPARVELEGGLDLTVGGYGALAQIRSSWFDGATRQFNVEAFGALRVPGLGAGDGIDFRAEAVLSSRGYAVCAGEQGERFGFARLWRGELHTFVNACDIGGFRAGSAQAGGPHAFSVRSGTRVLAVAADGAPELTGPRGVRLAAPGRSAAGLVVRDGGTTWFILRRPAAGRWRVTGAARVAVADPLPPVRLRVRVSGRGARRTLSWRGLPGGHRLVLNELGRGSSRVVLQTGRARGRRTFTPAPGPGRARRLVATVTRRGLPRFEGTVARFTAPRPTKLTRVRGLRRKGATIRWRAQPAAARYALSLLLADGSTRSRMVRRPRTHVGGRGPVVVTVVALSADGRAGPPARATLRR